MNCLNIQGNIVTFGIKEFALVMGLKTSSGIELERNNFAEGSLRFQIFGKRTSIKKIDIKEKFKSYDGKMMT